MASILGEELALPNIQPKGKKTIQSVTDRYTSIGLVGPDSLRHFKRTYKEALKRQITTGSYSPENPIIVPIRRDMRFRSAKENVEYDNAAVVIYMMDVSGSMGDEQKEIVRTESFWINLWQSVQRTLRFVTSSTMQRQKKSIRKRSFARGRVEGFDLFCSETL